MTRVLLKTLSIFILFTILISACSCTNTKNGETPFSEATVNTTEPPESTSLQDLYGKAIVEFNGELVDISTIPKGVKIPPSYDFFPQSFSELEEYIKKRKNGCILKVTVTGIAKQDTAEPFCYIHIPIVINEVLYKSENITIEEGQELDFLGRMYIISFSMDKKLDLLCESHKTCAFFIGGEYFIVGYYNSEEKSIFPCVSYSGVIEITNFSDTHGFKGDPMGFKEEAFSKYNISGK